jgi:hypothetical protein
MNKAEVVSRLKDADCDDPAECLFGLFDYDEKFNSLCRATDPPRDPYDGVPGCPFCKMVAEMLEGGTE